MKVNITQDQNGQKIYNILWPNTQLDFFLMDRDSVLSYDKEAVYILMDRFRRCFYIGETGGSLSGGIRNRFRTHKWEKGFWDCALVVRDRNGGFAPDAIRKWFEWQLNGIAKSANTAVVLSSAGKQDEPYGVEERMNAILSVCRFLGISWAFQKEDNKAISLPLKKSTKAKAAKAKFVAKQKTSVDATSMSLTQFANMIACRAGSEGVGVGGLRLILAGRKINSGKPCRPGTKWRKPLEDAGVKFDKDDYVTDWKHAKIPMRGNG